MLYSDFFTGFKICIYNNRNSKGIQSRYDRNYARDSGKGYKSIKKELDIPIIAGGLIDTEKEIADAISGGAIAVSTGKREFWGGI